MVLSRTAGKKSGGWSSRGGRLSFSSEAASWYFLVFRKNRGLRRRGHKLAPSSRVAASAMLSDSSLAATSYGHHRLSSRGASPFN